MIHWFAAFWRWSWIILLPFLSIIFFLFADVGNRYFSVSVKQLGDTYLGGQTLQATARLSLKYHLTRFEQDVKRAFGLLPADSLRNIKLFIAESDLAKLNSDLPASGDQYVPALMVYDGKPRRVKMKYRGDFHYHWAFYKKSLRIKTGKGRLFEGMRRFNLIVPKTAAQINNFLGYELADMLGLVVPKHELVTVTLNGRYQGFYLLAEQIEESTLRSNRLMPGDIYNGDQMFGKDIWFGIYRSLFDHPGLWKKIAINNHYPEQHDAPLRELLSLLKEMQASPADESMHRRLEQILDLEQFARFNVMELFLNTHHYDMQHNWKLYFDPGVGKFKPLVWDPLGWLPNWLPGGAMNTWQDPDSPPSHVAASSLMHVLLKNGEFNRIRTDVIQSFFHQSLDQKFFELIDRTIETMQPVLQKDPSMITLDLDMADAEQALQAMQDLKKISTTIFIKLRELYLTASGVATSGLARSNVATSRKASYSMADNGRIAISLTSYVPAQTIRILSDSINDLPDHCQIYYWTGNGERHTPICSRLTVKQGLNIDIPLISNYRWIDGSAVFNDFIRLAPAYYELSFGDWLEKHVITGVSVSWDGNNFVPMAEVELLTIESFDYMARIIPDSTYLEPVIWQGSLHLTESLEINSPLIIKPGTTIELDADVSVFVRNKLQILGTQDAPVTITSRSAAPFGALVIEGENARGSTIDYLHMNNGSGFKDAMREYSGMLSIHQVSDVRIRHCRLRNSHRVDDMVHLVYSDVEISHCTFRNAEFDAIDADMSKLSVSDSVFENNGNDAIDLMGTDAYLVNNRFIHNADKGVSVGERSRVIIDRAQFTRNLFAIQSKDDSTAWVVNSRFDSNNKALDAFRKNWRYGRGGDIIACNNQFESASAQISIDKHSSLWISPATNGVRMDVSGSTRVIDYCDTITDSTSIIHSQHSSANILQLSEWLARVEEAAGLHGTR